MGITICPHCGKRNTSNHDYPGKSHIRCEDVRCLRLYVNPYYEGRTMQGIYKPKGAAEEYCKYAINIYTGCTHGCTYCYARDYHNRFIRPKTGKEFGEDVRPRDGIVETVEAQLKSGKYEDQLIHLCFMCDPYPVGVDTTATRDIIKLIKQYGSQVQVLTKGADAPRDMGLLDNSDWFGVSISCSFSLAKINEPAALSPANRIIQVDLAKDIGINTWVSLEPVLQPKTIYDCIELSNFIDIFRIGKLNHRKSDIDWKAFGNKCVELCEKYGRKYEIKDALRKEMEG